MCGKLILASLVLMACRPVPPPPVADNCGAAGLQALVGQDRSLLSARTFPSGTRILEPGMPVTMDYNPARLDILIGRSDRIERVSCG